MCGRYALYERASEVRRQLEESHMRVDDCPEDEECRQTYNFPPGAFGVVYRADVPDYGAGPSRKERQAESANDADGEDAGVKLEEQSQNLPAPLSSQADKETKYKLQSMKWGLVPSWTKRAPDYGSVMRTINARDDSLAENRGIWNVPKRRKRCIVIAQGFYEWLKKNGGKEKIPHYIKRKDNRLMCMAGLWDCVRYEDSDEKHYTYTVITTDSNKQMSFLHNRMPVILENGSDALTAWLDPGRYDWTTELQSILKPFDGELEIYPVSKEVGKVGNNSPSFIIPIDSAANKSNIANFFSNQKKQAKGSQGTDSLAKAEEDVKDQGLHVSKEREESRETTQQQDMTESNAPLPASSNSPRGAKRERSEEDIAVSAVPAKKAIKSSEDGRETSLSPAKPMLKMKNATSNGSAGKQKSPSKPAKSVVGTPKITNFFGK